MAVIYFQVSTRRLQIRVEELETKICMLLAELGNKNVEINRLRRELVEKIATILTLQARGTMSNTRVYELPDQAAGAGSGGSQSTTERVARELIDAEQPPEFE